jgi:ammonia channel protein AmtB
MNRSATAEDTIDQPPVTRDDLEAKMRELQGEVSDTAGAAGNVLLVVGAAAGVAAIAVVFLLGRRSGRKKTTVVEVRRV